MAGRPLGLELQDLQPTIQGRHRSGRAGDGSILAVLATDAPLLPGQLKRLARRMSLGLARTGGLAAHSSGDLFLAFSSASPHINAQGLELWAVLDSEQIDPLLKAAAYATEEAIINALCAAEDMSGYAGNHVFALPYERFLSSGL